MNTETEKYVLQLLLAAKARVADPRHWIKLRLYTDARLRIVDRAEEAVCFCALGAVRASLGEISRVDPVHRTTLSRLSEVIYPLAGDSSIATYNDSPTTKHADIVAMFDAAIKRTEVLIQLAEADNT